MMYQRYTCPLEFMKLYIDSGQFGEFVSDIIKADRKRKQEEAEQKNERQMWELYLHSMSEKSFNDWKSDLLSQSQKTSPPASHAMSDAQVNKTINESRDILKTFRF